MDTTTAANHDGITPVAYATADGGRSYGHAVNNVFDTLAAAQAVKAELEDVRPLYDAPVPEMIVALEEARIELLAAGGFKSHTLIDRIEALLDSLQVQS